jgi:hypothetical protein
MTSPFKKNHFKKTALALAMGSLLTGCFNSSSDSNDNNQQTETDQRVSITGFAVKGILANAIVEAYDISGTTLLATTTTDADGKYTLPNIAHDGPVLVKLKTSASTQATCDSAVGCDDGSGTPVPFGAKYTFNDSEFDLSAVLPSAAEAANQELMVTPVTHMAAKRVIAEGATSSEDIDGLNRATATLLGLDGVDINTVAPVDITDATATNEGSAAAQLYGTLVASIQTLAEKDPEASIADVVDSLANDYAASGGLVSNSDDEEKITLEEIFTEAIVVVAAAEEKAADDGIEVDLDAAETQLDTEQAEAKNAEPDQVVEVEPEIIIPTEELTQAQATQAGIDLLLDLNAWEDALTDANNETLIQPFQDQVKGTDLILENIGDQSKLLQGFARLIGEEEAYEECYDWDMNGVCQYSETYTEFNAGPVLGVVGVFGSLSGLSGELQNLNQTDGNYSFDYAAQLGTVNAIDLYDLTDILSDGEDAQGNMNVVYGLTANYTVREGKIETVTYVMDSEDPAYPNNFSITLTHSDFIEGEGADSNKIQFGISASSINLPSENIVLTIPQGTTEAPSGFAALTFATAADRIAFSSSELEDPSLAKLTGIDVQFETQGTLTGATNAAGTALPTTDASLSIAFDYDYDSAAEAGTSDTTASLAMGIQASNTEGEEINGELKVTAEGVFSENEVAATANSPAYFEQSLDLDNANAVFTGNVINTATGLDGSAQKAEFSGTATADMSFFAPAIEAADDKQLVETAVANLEGSILVSSTPTTGADAGKTNTVGFVGSAEVTMALVKTPQGVPFKLYDEEQYHPEKVKLFGRLSADQGIDADTLVADRSASLAINAVVNADIAGLQYNQIDLPLEGDELAQLKYGIRSIDADNAQAYINKSAAINDARTALANMDIDVKPGHGYGYNTEDQIADFARSNCITPANTAYLICDVTATHQNIITEWYPTQMSEAEALQTLQQRHSDNAANNYIYNPIFTEPSTQMTLSAADVAIDHQNCMDNLTPETPLAQCIVTRSHTATANVPVEIASHYDKSNYLRGLDARQDPNFHYDMAVSTCVDIAMDNLHQECTITRSSDGEAYLSYLPTLAEKQATLESWYPNSTISNLQCTESGPCTFIITYESNVIELKTLSSDTILAIEQGKYYSNDYQYQVDPSCDTATCAVTLTDSSEIQIPAGLTEAERETHFTKIENGYVSLNETLSIKSCNNHDDGSMLCEFDHTQVDTHNAVVIDNSNGLTKFIAFIIGEIFNGYNPTQFHSELETSYGYLSMSTPYGQADLTFTGDIAAGANEEKTVPVTINYFDPEFDAEELAAGEGAFVQVSATLNIKADLTGLDDAEISIFVDRLGEEDAEGRIKLFNGDRMVELNINSTEAFNDGSVNNFTIRNANAEMTLVMKCATDTNGDGVHDNDFVAACGDGINFQGDIFVGEFKVADLEDRNGLPVFSFEDGSGYDLVVTPNFVVQPSAQ